ncbi:ABC transporter permease [Tessaracoccus massiliensis]|uniref:ABC transporter permease n=1 Tax=Tessaracoccus massiliensis TaxID=1522311 RepID=UPI00058F87FD|nr:ABC transporter permease [Tessaracoccus massiliensis]
MLDRTRVVGTRPLRVALTVAGTVVGIATLVAVLGLTTSAQGQIDDRFSFLRATLLEIQPKDPSFGTVGFTPEGLARIIRIDGVDSAGWTWQVSSETPLWVSRTVPSDDLGKPPTGIPVHAATQGFLESSKATMQSGRGFDAFCVEHECRVAVLGKVAAERLGVTMAHPDVTIFINGIGFRVIGIIDDMSRNTSLLGAVTIPSTTAVALWGSQENASSWMTVDTRIGAAAVVAEQAPYALRPENLDAYNVITPPDPRQLQATIGADLGSLFLVLAGITLLVGAFGITNLTTVSVMERVPEIGLRRALGATPGHIAAQFVGESSLLGLIGGLIGSPLGIAVVVAVCVVREWTALLPPSLLATPAFGLIIGLLAGLYPAWRAARMEPVAALQR